MAGEAFKLPGLAEVLLGIRQALADGAAELRKIAADVPEPVKSELLAAAAKLEGLLDSAELATVGLRALDEVRELLTTGKSLVRHRPGDIR